MRALSGGAGPPTRAMTRRDTHRGRHVQLREALDELVTDFLLHHPGEPFHALTVRRLAIWAAAQAQRPTEPPPARRQHNGSTFRPTPDRRHYCVLTPGPNGDWRCTICAARAPRRKGDRR